MTAATNKTRNPADSHIKVSSNFDLIIHRPEITNPAKVSKRAGAVNLK
jgi:hypothetical protein